MWFLLGAYGASAGTRFLRLQRQLELPGQELILVAIM